jgi:hypothetical protein
MVRITLILILISSLCHGQIPPGVTAVSSRYIHPPSEELTYIPLPNTPTFSDTHTLVYATTGSGIQVGDTNGKSQFYFGSDYVFLQWNGLSGNIIAMSLDPTDPTTWAELGSPSPNDYSMDVAVSIIGISLYKTKLVDSDNLFKVSPANPTKNYLFEDMIYQGAGFAGSLINGSIASANYGDITYNFCRFIECGGEGIYGANTGNETSTYEGISTMYNIYTYNTGREGIQCNGHSDLRIDKVTIIGAGQETSAGIGQNNAIQLQNIYTGHLKDFIFWDCRAPGMLATQDFLFENGIWDWNEPDREIYLQSMDGNSYLKKQHPGGTVHFKNIIFRNPDLTLDWIMKIQDSECNIIFEDCTFPTSAVDIYKDERSDKLTYSITVINPTFSDAVSTPTFGPPPESGYVGYEQVVTDSYWHGRGAGYRTPNP